MDARSKFEKQPSLVVSLFITGTKQPNLVIFDNQTWWLVAATKNNISSFLLLKCIGTNRFLGSMIPMVVFLVCPYFMETDSHEILSEALALL
jgi:uncharacterized membrane-anchored protein YitT (DUF2179 family)